MAELADAADLKSAGLKRPVGVRVPLSAPMFIRGSSILAVGFSKRFLGTVPNFVPTSNCDRFGPLRRARIDGRKYVQMRDALVVMVVVGVVVWAATREKSKRRRLAIIFAAPVLSALAWFAFRTLRGLMALGYVDSAIVRVRAVGAAEAQFAKAHPEKGYTCTISQLPQDELVVGLANGGIDNGYAFRIVGCQTSGPQKPNTVYQVTARPLHSWLPAFCSDASGVLRSDDSGSVEKCLATGVPVG
jgi:hypothetical protein